MPAKFRSGAIFVAAVFRKDGCSTMIDGHFPSAEVSLAGTVRSLESLALAMDFATCPHGPLKFGSSKTS